MAKENDLFRVCGLWVNKDKNGNDYFSGDFTFNTKLVILKNSYKQKEGDPDYFINLAPKKKKSDAKTNDQDDNPNDIPF